MFTDRDKAMHKGLMKILNDATFPLKAKEVGAFVEIMKWAKELPNMEAPKPIKKKRSKRGN